MLRIVLLTTLLLTTLLSTVASAATISYDSQCLTIDGKDVLVFSGAFHYFRCPKEVWPDRFRKIKGAGFNTVETYVAWNWCEREMPTGVSDFSKVDLADLKDWLKMAHEQFGLYTIVRPGPYICAEWAGGGYPAWLMTKRPSADVYSNEHAWLRSDEPTYLAWSKHWYDAVCPVIAAEQVTKKPAGKPGVILFQIENEYDFYGDAVTEQQRLNHLKALHRDARADGIEVPIFTCWTKQCRGSSDPELKDVFDGSNFYPRWDMKSVEQRLADLRKQQPNAPMMIPECQGGWFAQVGGSLSEDQNGIDATQINHLTLLAFSRGVRILNYYMLFGGTNFGDWSARGDITSYDYNAPIREWGGVGDRYQAVKAIGQLLHAHAEELVRAADVNATVSGAETGVEIRVQRTKSDAAFVFCRNTTTSAKQGKAEVKLDGGESIELPYELDIHAFKILYLPPKQTEVSKGEWWPKAQPAIDRPESPAPIRIKSAMKRSDAWPEESTIEWSDVKPGESLVSRGVYDSRYVLYRAMPTLSEDQLKSSDALWLDLFRKADDAALNVNGQLVHAHGVHHGQPVFPMTGLLHAGENRIVALYENKGWGNFGRADLETVGGVRGGMLTSSKLLGMSITQWRSKLIDPGGDAKPLVAGDADDSSWPAFVLDDAMVERLRAPLQPGAETPGDRAARILFDHRRIGVFRASIDLTDADLQAGRTRLAFAGIDDRGQVYVNGAHVGDSKRWDQPSSFDCGKALKIGHNTIAVIVDNSGGGTGGLTGAVHLEGDKLDGTELHWQLATDLPGVKARWFDPVMKSADGWQPIELGTAKPIARKGGVDVTPMGSADSLATWYRMEFELPPASKEIWIPWRAVLDASGNGFIYLNGHPLGRLWQAGPQREFFLPECWLHFGPGEKNVLTLCLRPIERGAFLRAAEISPYPDQAERRQ